MGILHLASRLVTTTGIVNVVMAGAPLLKGHPQAVLLTSYMKYLPQERQAFFQKLLFMSAHTASILLGQPQFQ